MLGTVRLMTTVVMGYGLTIVRASSVMKLALYQALTLGLWVQWPGGPVDLKTYWPPKKLTGPGGQ